MNRARWLNLAAAALLIGLLPACNRDSGRPKVAVVSNNAADFWTIAEAGARKGEKEFGVEVIFRRPAPADAAEQKKIIDALVAQGVKGIAVSVIDPTNQTDYLNSIAARTNLLTQDNDAPESKRICYVGTNNYEAGKAVGELVKEVMPDGGIFAVFVGQTTPLNARQRYQGVIDALAGEKDAKGKESGGYMEFGKYRQFGDVRTDEADQKKAADNAKAVLSALAAEIDSGKPVCMIGLWAYNPPAILNAVTEQGYAGKVHIVGFDEDRATLQGIMDGHIHGTVVQQPFEFGYQSVRIMAKLAQGDESVVPEDGLMYVPHRVITKEGGDGRVAAAKFQKFLDDLLSGKEPEPLDAPAGKGKAEASTS
ncbi:MAG TPA: sugar-binding protein [Gemmataceae bacterium]